MSEALTVVEAPPQAPKLPKAPKKRQTTNVRVKGPPDLNARVLTKLTSIRPKGSQGKAPVVNMDFSRSSVSIMSNVTHVLTTGIDPVDLATGIGGLPFGRVVELYGLDGSLKSALSLRSASRLQAKYIYRLVRDEGDVASQNFKLEPIGKDAVVFTIYIDNEQSIAADGKLVIDGVQLDCIVARCDTVDQVFKIVDTAIAECVSFSKENDVEVFIAVVIDTIAGTSSKEEMTDAWDKENYQRQAKGLRQGFRILIRELARQNVLVIATNQVGDSFAKKVRKGNTSMVPQDEDFSTFGGRALKYYASIRIFLYKMNVNWKLSKKLKFPSGMTVGFIVTKNRLGKPWRSGRIVCLFNGGLSNTFSRLETLAFLKLCERSAEGTGVISFKCVAAGIPLTTFPEMEKERAKNPKLDSLEEWPAFSQAHKPEMDALWQCARDIMFLEKPPEGVDLGEDVDESIESAVDVVED